MYKWQLERECPEEVRNFAYYLSYHRDRHIALLHNGKKCIAAIRYPNMAIKHKILR